MHEIRLNQYKSAALIGLLPPLPPPLPSPQPCHLTSSLSSQPHVTATDGDCLDGRPPARCPKHATPRHRIITPWQILNKYFFTRPSPPPTNERVRARPALLRARLSESYVPAQHSCALVSPSPLEPLSVYMTFT